MFLSKYCSYSACLEKVSIHSDLETISKIHFWGYMVHIQVHRKSYFSEKIIIMNNKLSPSRLKYSLSLFWKKVSIQSGYIVLMFLRHCV
jgi:hypothetical protein